MASAGQKLLLGLSLIDRRRAFCPPFYVDLDITGRCNLKCPGCPYHSPQLSVSATSLPVKKDMDYTLIVRIFKELKAMGTKEIVLLGSGEPMLHKRFIDIVKQGKAAGFKLTVLTNGTLLNKKTAQELASCGLDQIKVSLWAANKPAYEKTNFEAAPVSFDHLMDGLRSFHDIKKQSKNQSPFTVIHFPVYQGNINQLESLVDIACACKVDGLALAPVYDAHDARQPLQLNDVQVADLIQKLELLAVKSDDLGIHHNLDEMKIRLMLGKEMWQTMPCYVGMYHAKIRFDGTVHPCCRCNMPLGNIKNNQFREIWNAIPYRTLRRRTLSRENLQEFSTNCNCSYCAFIPNNHRIFQYDRYISPLARLLGR